MATANRELWVSEQGKLEKCVEKRCECGVTFVYVGFNQHMAKYCDQCKRTRRRDAVNRHDAKRRSKGYKGKEGT